MPLSNAKADELLNDTFRDEPLYLALYTSNPTGADTGTEVAGGGYARQLIAFDAPHADGGVRTINNSGLIQFPVATADWGTITHIALRSALTGGSLIAYGELLNTRTILSGDRFVINVGSGAIKFL